MSSMSDRDRKILIAVVPLVLIIAYWFLLLSPKREEAATAKKEAGEQQQRLASARMLATQADGAKTNFAADYGEIVRLGKAIPSKVDMPSLIVQLDRAARGTGIDFDKISTGERQAAPVPTPAASSSGSSAQSGPGKAVQTATDANGKANAAAAAAAGNTTPGAAGGASTGAPGLETVPLDFTFKGSYFDLAQFLHRMKRFVRVANDDLVIRGRLITIDTLNWKTDTTSYPDLTAEVHATVYLAPKAQGASAGATPQGPGATPAATPAAGTTPAPASPSSTTAPAATVR